MAPRSQATGISAKQRSGHVSNNGSSLTTFASAGHSMAACLAGDPRPWQIALSSYTDRSLVEPMLEALRRPGDVTVGDNQPYNLDPAVDYSTPFHRLDAAEPPA